MTEMTMPDRIVYPTLSITAVSTDSGLEIAYFGAQDYADVEVTAATGDITLKHGVDSSTEVVDSSLGLPVADETTGIIDVSDTEADTFGEIADYINKKANWRVRLLGVRRADIATNTLATKTQTQANITAAQLLRDTTVAVQTNTYTIGLRVTPQVINGPASGGWTERISNIDGVVTFTAAGTGTGYNDGDGALNDCRIIVYSINPLLKTQRRVWYSDPLTSGVTFQFDAAEFPGLQDLSGDPGEELLVLIQNSGTGAVTLTSPTLTIEGYRELSGGVGRVERWHLSNS